MLGHKVASLTDEFIKELQTIDSEQPYPRSNWVDKMAWSPHDDLHPPWLLGKPKTNGPLQSDDESKQLAKAHAIATQPSQVLSRGTLGNYEIDSVIGKRDDKQALCTLIDIHTGFLYLVFYNSNMIGLRNALQALLVTHHIKINPCTMDNDKEHNLLHSIIDWSQWFNYHPYTSSEKRTLINP